MIFPEGIILLVGVRYIVHLSTNRYSTDMLNKNSRPAGARDVSRGSTQIYARLPGISL